MLRVLIIILLMLVACGKEDKDRQMCMVYGENCHPDKEEQPTPVPTSPEQSELDKLRRQVLALQGTVSQINDFVASDFTNCNGSLPAFETKICEIAQTSTAEQQAVFVGQLQQIAKIFQTELYGEDCLNTVDPGCPVSGSITEKVSTLEAAIADLENDILDIQADLGDLEADVSLLQSDVTAIKGRLNNFDGSGNSIETVITGINSTLSTLNSRISAIETAVNNGDIYKTYLICRNIAASGPAYEPILISGNNTKATAYLVNGTSNGMGVISTAGVTGDLYLTTKANSSSCKFKIYDLTTSIKLCWKNDNRSATTGQIDTACNAPSFAAPLGTCTCVN